MDTTLKRYKDKIVFKTRDPAEAPIDAYWLTKKKKKLKKHRKKAYFASAFDNEINRHMGSIKQELNHRIA